MTGRGGPIRWLFRLGHRRPRPEDAAEWEVEHHLAELADRLVEAGWSQEEARREAERRFGDARRYRARMKRIERGRMAMRRRVEGWDFVREGVAGTVRTARRYPGFALAVIVTLGLGIGANAAMFGIVDRLLLRPPAYVEEAEEVKRVFVTRPSSLRPGETSRQSILSYPDYLDLKAHGGLESVAAFAQDRPVAGSGPEAERADAVLTTYEFFPLLGVEPYMGRLYGPEEDVVGAPLTAVVSHEYWERALGSDPDVLGRTLELSGDDFTIIGVAPPGFTGVDLEHVDVWVPLEPTRSAAWSAASMGWLENRGWLWMKAVARLGDDVTLASAEDEATRLHLNGRREQIEEGDYPREARVELSPLVAARGAEPSEASRVARWLAGVSLIVLLIACANVANLLLARGARRRREVAVRLALGVSRRRLVGGMVLESVILALAGGAVALALAHWGGGLIRGVLLPDVYFPEGAVSGRVLVFTAGVSLLAGVVAGVGPALRSTRTDLAEDLSEARRGSSVRRSRLRGALTVAQAAMSVVLLVGAGLFVRSLDRVRGLDLGLDVDRLVMARFDFAVDGLDARERNDLHLRAIERLEHLPGVEAAAAMNAPFQWGFTEHLQVPGLDSIPRLPGGGPYYFAVTPGYFRTLGLGILRGRGLRDSDGEGGQRVTVISRTMADALWRGGDPLGRCLLVGRDAEACTTVVGVVEDAARSGFEDPSFMAFYLPLAQAGDRPGDRANGLYIRAADDAETLAPIVAPLLRTFAPEVRFATVQTMREILDSQARSWTLGATMFTIFGLLALVVAAIGLYSVLAFDVARRTRELGIRTALGAEKGRLLRSVVFEGTRLAALGVALGLIAAYFAAPFAEDLLFRIEPRDPGVMGLVAAVLGAVAVAASLVPGLRATRVDPMVALRTE